MMLKTDVSAQYKTKYCKKYLNGYCPYGPRCLFIHDPSEAKITQKVQILVEKNGSASQSFLGNQLMKMEPISKHPSPRVTVFKSQAHQ